jgi:hypothetical protein
MAFLPSRPRLFAAAAVLAAATTMTLPAASATGASPDLAAGAGFLAAPANLIDGHYYELFPGFADWGLTMDGAFALAATGSQDAALTSVVNYLDQAGSDGSGNTINSWTGIGTPDVSGGSLGKEALLAEVVGRDPQHFGGQDLLAALNASVCAGPSTAPDTACAAAGNYRYTTSVFSQSLGILAQLRAGGSAAAPVGYLESLQEASGAWPSLIPSTGNADVDSTAMAVMTLALLPDATAQAAVTAGLSWLAGQQAAGGGFPGVNPDSVNSTGLAMQALSLDQAGYGSQINKASAFLASQQNADGGFNIEPATPGSDIRATAQAVGGATGISFGTLSHQVSALPSTTPSASSSATPTPTPTRTTPASRPSSATPSATIAASTPIENSAVGAGELADTGPHRNALLVAGLLLAAGIVLTALGRRRPSRGRYR